MVPAQSLNAGQSKWQQGKSVFDVAELTENAVLN
jgi:hypothetical protein